MNKYLIFRTDRVGDFLLSAILIKSIKRNDPNSSIYIVASEKNFNYIKSFSFIDKVFLFKKGLINKFKLIISLNKEKFNAIIIHDSKKRSNLISLFLNKKLKISLNSKNNISYLAEIKDILNRLNFNFKKTDLDILNNRSYNKFSNLRDEQIIFHFDEKWIHNEYIRDYTNIQPSENELKSFLNSLVKKTNKKIIITTGVKSPKILDKIFSNHFNNQILYFKKLNFFEIENLLDKANLVISCHGAISHLATAKNIEQIDIIEQSKSTFYNKWTDHFRNYKSVNRKKFNDLSKEILSLL